MSGKEALKPVGKQSLTHACGVPFWRVEAYIYNSGRIYEDFLFWFAFLETAQKTNKLVSIRISTFTWIPPSRSGEDVHQEEILEILFVSDHSPLLRSLSPIICCHHWTAGGHILRFTPHSKCINSICLLFIRCVEEGQTWTLSKWLIYLNELGYTSYTPRIILTKFQGLWRFGNFDEVDSIWKHELMFMLNVKAPGWRLTRAHKQNPSGMQEDASRSKELFEKVFPPGRRLLQTMLWHHPTVSWWWKGAVHISVICIKCHWQDKNKRNTCVHMVSHRSCSHNWKQQEI